MNESSGKHAALKAQNLVTGLVIIAVGVYLLLRNFGIEFPFPFMYMHNWWALFILIGAVGPLMQAVHAFRRDGRLSADVARPAITTLVIVTIALMFLLDLRWHRWWPIFVIYAGLWIVARERPAGS